ncbi:GTPase ObgE [Candidatus Bipolaricaulota bacterium]|nr:GTPase ObgE [Candidatus Bipolaricaulota bacterium]
MFLDEAIIRVRGGHGGNGVITFASSYLKKRGGPDGGNGGNGGDILLVADSSLSTLYAFRNQPLFAGGNGAGGGRNNAQGACGEDRIVRLPQGTVVYDAGSREMIADLSTEGETLVVARGGKGGRGNRAFTTAVRQAPRICERGLGGERITLRLELKLLADVGLIGFPNVGKSSLIARISGSRAKVADYPFTTIVPNLGVVDVDGVHQFVAVDVPGLVEQAHEGKGLGDQFLRHVERTRVLVHLIDLACLDGRDPVDAYTTICNELEAFHPNLVKRPMIVVGNKADLVDEERIAAIREQFREINVMLYPISVATGYGVRDLVKRTYHVLSGIPREEQPAAVVRRRVYRFDAHDEGFRVVADESGYSVRGRKIEELVKMLVLDSDDAWEYLGKRLDRMGIIKELERAGAKTGDVVRIANVEFEFER